MKVIVGLGNPGSKYEHTPHNAGFGVVDRLADLCECKLRRSLRFRTRQGRCTWKGNELLLVQPQAYMNNSGVAVAAILRYFKADSTDLIVVVDDADLELGRMRIRPDGGTGGHKGLDSIIQHLNSKAFPRLRIGVGKGGEKKNLVGHVLKRFSQDEREKMAGITEEAAEAVLLMLDSGIDTAMNRFNAAPGGQNG